MLILRDECWSMTQDSLCCVAYQETWNAGSRDRAYHQTIRLCLLVRLFEFWRLVVRSTGFSRKMGYIGMPWQGVFRLKAVLQTELKQSS
jgi:hypothetical protein